ncbi:bifunctional 5,10-methylenetetrahydrofolate dehydrogenase/5,10-methenyltetrahydrofolate cyclohydrolase [Bacteroidota bacterium]|nr:bifunctional 5,10-methylenetetrahydrofolate dehydrogenase/5,10-methenyltetrahydrofolate cyclohydrolase [Bacteroidota bacterium]MDC3153954.1 bifunctional 5,10-methylenetetrahydrofolate dehydrogenase/5,10-methenyltetrahydrofolate cyclohydrolase [Bacteroidota bacterium]
MKILDGKYISSVIRNEIKTEVERNSHTRPHLCAILIGDNGASRTYVNAKVKACEEVGFKSTLFHYDDISELDLLDKIEEINNDKNIDGLIVQLPLPKHIDENKITLAVKPGKDVDGFHPVNMGKMMLGLDSMIPATPAGIIELIKRYKIETLGKKCVVIGRSNIVGLPISVLLAKNKYPGNCTVTLTHSKSKNLKEICASADILIVALGVANFIKSDMVKKNCVIIDVGISRVKSDKTKSGWKLLGDVDFENVKEKCDYITPVPGGVGPMTIAMLLANTLKAAKNENKY